MKFFLSLILISFCSLIQGNAQTLSIEFEGIKAKHIGKKLYIGYWQTSDPGFPEAKKVQIGEEVLIESKDTEFLKELPAEEYAISAYIDMNSNGKFDKNFLGMPKEPYFLSNGVKPKFSAPAFEECSFTFDKDTSITLEVIE